jgi:hypothetical protein
MFYTIKKNNKIIYESILFVDAWLFAKMELKVFSTIDGPDGSWKVEPYNMN